MLKKIFQEKWFVNAIHFVIVVGIFLNSFYILENFKVSKNNILITNQKVELEQAKKNLLTQNSFEFLDNYKDKMIKKAGFKNIGEDVFDISIIDSQKEDYSNSSNIPNYQKWYKCLFTTNFQEKIIGTDQITTNNLCK